VAQLLEFTVKDGGSVLLEVDEATARPVTRGGGRAESAVIQAGVSLEHVLGQLGPTLQSMVEQVREAAQQPDEVQIEFAVKVSTDANVIIARAGGEANFRIALKWCHGGR
jgi:hypothetical protein